MRVPSLPIRRTPKVHARTAPDTPSKGGGKALGLLSLFNGSPVPIGLLAAVVLLLALGLVTVYVATLTDPDYSFTRQLLGVALGIVACAAFWVFDYRLFGKLVIPLLVLDIVLMLLPMVPGLGVESNGATSWIRIGGFSFQPSELAKPVTIVMLAAAVSKYDGSIVRGRDYFKMLALILIPFVLLVREDLGTALVIFIFGFIILFVGGASRRWLVLTIMSLAVLVAGMLGLNGLISNWTGGSVQLIKPYQMSRLLVFIDQDNPDYADDAYNLNQAKIAVGSGEITGKGFGNATQSSGGFLPEAATDFIFCVYAEQFGFMGCFILLALYLALLAAALSIGMHSGDMLGMLIAAGIMGMWLFQIVENIGMDIGLMPITGIPLPFMSYGSSFMLTNFICVGLLSSIWTRRGEISAQPKRAKGKAGQLHV